VCPCHEAKLSVLRVVAAIICSKRFGVGATNNYAMAPYLGTRRGLGHWTEHRNAIYAAVNSFEQYASPVAPTEDDQSALPENRHESKTDARE
jgi:hypothetical protein